MLGLDSYSGAVCFGYSQSPITAKDPRFDPFEVCEKVVRHKNSKIVENHLNPIILVFIGKLTSSTLR